MKRANLLNKRTLARPQNRPIGANARRRRPLPFKFADPGRLVASIGFKPDRIVDTIAREHKPGGAGKRFERLPRLGDHMFVTHELRAWAALRPWTIGI